MLQVIDYNTGLFGIIQTESYTPLDLKIGDSEFSLPRDQLRTLIDLPTEVFKKQIRPKDVKHYIDSDGNVISLLDWKTEYDMLRSKMVWDSDADSNVWETRQDKSEYDAFFERWTVVYDEQSTHWELIAFEVIKKQFIPEKYAKYITSTIIVGSTSNHGQSVYKAICNYTTNPIDMIRTIADKLGFIVVDSDRDIKGKRIFISNHNSVDSIVRFSKVNDKYFNIPECDYKRYGNLRGTFEECAAKYEWEYKTIYEFLLGVANRVDHPTLNSDERDDLAALIDNSLASWNRISPMKTSRDEYRTLGNKLTELKKKLLLIPMMLLLLMVGCSEYKHDGKLVRTQDGELFRLR